MTLFLKRLYRRVVSSQIGNNVKEGDYQIKANNEEGANGYVQFPHTENEVTQNKSSYASYNFRLTAPVSVVWTTTLTNGLEFAFGTDTSEGGKPVVSQGIAGNQTYV